MKCSFIKITKEPNAIMTELEYYLRKKTIDWIRLRQYALQNNTIAAYSIEGNCSTGVKRNNNFLSLI